MAAHYEQQRQAAEEQRRIQNEQRIAEQRRQAEAESKRIMAETERQIANINAVEDFVSGRIMAYANNTELRNLAREARSLDTTLEDPAALLADYRSKVATLREYAQVKQQEFAAAMDELRELTAQLLAEAESEAQAAGQLAVLAFQATGHVAIKAREQQQSRILREELEKAFNSMKNDLVADNKKGMGTAQVNEAKAMSFAIQEWAGTVVSFYSCNIDQINARFSYDDTSWAEPDCSQPSSVPSAPPVSTPQDAVALGKNKLERARQGGTVAAQWLETATMLADGAAEMDRSFPDAWALKADITPDSIDKLAWYRRARDLNNDAGWQAAYDEARRGFSDEFFSAIQGQKTTFVERASEAGVHWLAEGRNGESPILVALASNDKATVQTTFRIFEHQPTAEGGPLLHLAASQNQELSILGLLASEVPIDWRDDQGKTAYYIAVSTGSDKAADVLSESEPDHLALMGLALQLDEVETADKLGMLGMAIAIDDDDISAAEQLLRNNARLITMPYDQQDGFASWATRNGHREWLELFLQNGAFVDDTDLGGDPLLFTALESEQFDTADFLLRQGAAVDSQTTSTGETVLHAAVLAGPEWVDRMLTEGAIPDLPDKKGRTPLHAAVAADRADVIPSLINAKSDTSMQDAEGATPAILAAKQNAGHLLDLILPSTEAIDLQDGQGQTLLHHVVANQLAPTLTTLLKREARLDIADKTGDMAMHVALHACSTGAAHTLHDAGAPLAPQNEKGERPMHLAARCGDIAIVAASLSEDISANSPTKMGRTPLHEAASEGHTLVALMLLENQADKALRDVNGARPTKLARKGGYKQTRSTISKYRPPKDPSASFVTNALRSVGLNTGGGKSPTPESQDTETASSRAAAAIESLLSKVGIGKGSKKQSEPQPEAPETDAEDQETSTDEEEDWLSDTPSPDETQSP